MIKNRLRRRLILFQDLLKQRLKNMGEQIMSKTVFLDDDFRRMARTDMAKLQRLIDEKKFGIHEVSYGDRKVKVSIKKNGDTIQVKIFRVS